MRPEPTSRQPVTLPRLARCLPRHAREEWFAPAFADLRAECRERRLGSSSRPLRLRAWYIASVAWLFVESLRLAAQDSLRGPSHRTHIEARPLRKDWTAMVTRDVRGALRIFRREPAFAATAVLTLTLGIGANTALFAVVEAVLLRPLPYAESDRLVVIKHREVETGLTKW